MKIGKISVFSIAWLILGIANIAVRQLYPSAYPAFSPYFVGAMVSLFLVYSLYLTDKWVSAWKNIKKEQVKNT